MEIEKLSLAKYRINDFPATKEEAYIGYYLNELKEKGFIEEIIFQPDPFTLFKGLPKRFYKEKQGKKKVITKYSKKQYLINPHIYTADFKVNWKGENSAEKIEQQIDLSKLNQDIPFISNCSDNYEYSTYLEVKGSFDRNNMTRMFTHHVQPQIWKDWEIYIQLVKPESLFKDTFIPGKVFEDFYYKVGKKKGQKKKNWKYRTINEYLKDKTNEKIR